MFDECIAFHRISLRSHRLIREIIVCTFVFGVGCEDCYGRDHTVSTDSALVLIYIQNRLCSRTWQPIGVGYLPLASYPCELLQFETTTHATVQTAANKTPDTQVSVREVKESSKFQHRSGLSISLRVVHPHSAKRFEVPDIGRVFLVDCDGAGQTDWGRRVDSVGVRVWE